MTADRPAMRRLRAENAALTAERDEALAALAFAAGFVTANDEMGQALTEACATFASIRAIVADPHASLVVERVRAALETTDPTRRG